ncbi:MAG: NAD-dependent epimerase/dehydratase family protein [Sulfitobacter sp.]
MTGTVLILGANGRFGRAATQAFAQNGWDVRAASRAGEGAYAAGVKGVACDVNNRKAVIEAAKGVDVIVHAIHPPYPEWSELLPIYSANVIAAGLSSGATVMIAGNVYSFGKDAPVVLREDAAPTPSTRKGVLRVTMERTFADAAQQGLRTVVLRCGDFFEGTATGNWFEDHMVNKVDKGVFMYPGRMDAVHAWAYLPDVGRALADLADKRHDLPMFSSFGFEGFSLTGAELKAAVERAAGRSLKLKSMPWGILRLMGLFSPLMREVIEMRYLWNKPHRIDGAPLQAILPDFQPTSLATAMVDALSLSQVSAGKPMISKTRTA